jgi:hypothetical protein
MTPDTPPEQRFEVQDSSGKVVAKVVNGKWVFVNSAFPTDIHRPQRDDDVAAWLKRERDRARGTKDYDPIDGLLDRYRECADYGLTLRPEDEGKGDP